MHDPEIRPGVGAPGEEEITDEQILLAAAAKGERLRISYDEGSQPGAVREIWPVRIQGPFLLAFDGQTPRPKKFRLDFLSIEPDDAEITYRPRRLRRAEVDPNNFFAGFAFEVARPAFLPAFDFMLSERVVTVRGMKHRRRAWTQGWPPQFQFDQGDVFPFPSAEWRERSGLCAELAVLQVRDGGHRIMRVTAFVRSGSKWLARADAELSPAEFVDVLKNGPDSAFWQVLFGDEPSGA